tara:strand:+ start:173 stop:325 length:153 start_codon:yes stop_codon:yes gene_type:complete
MKNILGTQKDLKLFGSSGELRYSYKSNSKKTVEKFYNEEGEVEKKSKQLK